MSKTRTLGEKRLPDKNLPSNSPMIYVGCTVAPRHISITGNLLPASMVEFVANL